jgi:PAS domain S-box-containing protein
MKERRKYLPWRLHENSAAAYALATLIATAAVLLRLALAPYLTGVQFITFFPAVVLAAYACGKRAGVIAALLCGAAGWYLFVTPLYSFHIEQPAEAATLAAYFATAIAIALLVGGSRAAFRREQEAKEALRTSEARFRGVFDSKLLGLTIFDAHSGETLAINDTFLEMTGHTRADFEEGRWDWRNFTVDDYLALDEAATAQARERGSWDTFEKEYVRRDGTRFPVRLSSAPLPGEPGRVVVGIEDVTHELASQAALRDSEARLRLGLSAARMVVWTYSLADALVARSENAVEIFGLGSDPETFIARMPPEDAAADRARLEAAITGAVPRYESEFRYRHPDGRLLWLFNQGEVVRDPQGNALRLHGVCIDVTARKEAELALRHLNETLEQRVVDALAERKLLADLVEGTDAFVQVVGPDFRWLGINKAAAAEFERIYGVRPKPGDSMLDLLADKPEHQAAVRAVWARALSGEAFTAVGEFGDPGLERRYYEMKYNVLRGEDGQQIGAYQFVYDVTERVREQQRLAEVEAARREADALYRAYFENTPEALFVMNVLEDGGFTVEDLNPAHQASIGLPLAKVYGKRVDEVLPPETAGPVQEHYRRALATGGVYQYRDTFELQGKNTYWDTVLVPVRDGAGRIVQLIGSSRDLTPQMAAEEALRQSQKMEAMGQLTGGVAHDFNNLLTPIISSLDLLQRKGVGGEREQRMVSGAIQSAERARVLVQRLLAFARRQPLQPTAVDVGAIIAGMADLISSTTGPQIRVAVDVAPELPPAIADANQLEMALLNLAVNARDAMPSGGTLRISAEAATVGRQHRSNLSPGRYLQLSVADTGSGMDEATLARAIEPFFSTKGIGKGTGLGLSMVHGLALQLGGALTIRSKPGMGTNVELWLPQGEKTEAAIEAAAEQRAADVGRGTVLLVDDEDLVRLSTADMLIELGYSVVEAASAEEALRLLNRGLIPDIVVTDHLMPGMTGTELARLLRSDRPSTKVLIVSGYAENAGIAPDLPRLTKPFRNAELAASLSALA